MKNKTILLVDDNPDDIELTLLAFKKCNIQNPYFIAKDGEQAIEYLFAKGKYSNRDISEMPTVVLLDLKLPKIDGINVLKTIRANAQTKLIPIVILSSSMEEKDLSECYIHGANSYIRKSIDFVQFVEEVKSIGNYWLYLNIEPPYRLNKI